MPTIVVNGTRLAYDDAGPRGGASLVFSHSLFFNRRMFDRLAAFFSGHYRIVSYDHRGQGESDAATVEQLHLDVLTEDAAALIQALDLGPVHFAGNSLGGFIALRLAIRHPELLRSVVVMGSSAEEEHALEAFAPLVRHIRQNGTTEVIDSLMYIMFGDTTLSAHSHPVRDYWRQYILGLPHSIGDAAHQVVHRGSVVEALRTVNVPVLAIAGTEDHAYPPPISSEHIATATQGRQVAIGGAGHSVALEAADEVARHLATHLGAVEAARKIACAAC